MIRIGFIGCGNIARRHARAIMTGVRNMKVVAGADINPDALKSFGEQFSVPQLYPTWKDLLLKSDCHAVCVALPTYLHAAATMDAARAGRHVFCEKPMARSLRAADGMIEAARKASVTLMIGQVRRYDNNWGTFRKLIQQRAIGGPVFWRQFQGHPGPGKWFMDEKMGAGPFLDGCVHNWDFSNYCFGEPLEAVGSLMRMHTPSALDTGAVTVRYKSGDEISLTWCWGLPQGCAAGRAHEALGPKGVISFPESIAADKLPKDLNPETHGAYMVDSGAQKRFVSFRKNDMFLDEWKDFARAVSRHEPPVVTGEVGRQALAVGLAVLKAGDSRKPVKIVV